MISFVFLALLAVVVMLLVRWGVHSWSPGWGTIWANVMTALGVLATILPDLLAQFMTLPWSSILNKEEAAGVMFGISVANIIMRNLGKKGSVQ